jgi:DNA-binding SARP family transcriptional activator
MLTARLFGPLELTVGGRRLGPRDLGGGKPRQLLAILLLERGHVVSKQRLAELLWNDTTPVNVAATLDTYASTLRHHLEPDRRGPGRYLLGGGGGLRVPAELVELDLDRFDRLLHDADQHARRGDRAAARSVLESALSLVRGSVLEEEPHAAWAVRVRERYLERELSARLAAGEHALASGDPAGAVTHAQAVLDADPLREAGHRVLMHAYYRLGRQDEALRSFDRCRQVLADELGVDPLPETVELHAAVLRRDDLRLGDAAPARRPLQATTACPVGGELPFLGRAAELATLTAAADRALDGAGGLAIISGEPGIGKSRLVAELVSRLRPHRVGVGKCAEADRDLPYVPLAAALRDLGAAELAGARERPALAEILPELPPSGLPPEAARVRALESAAEVLRAAAPVTLVLDDVQWADASTVAALAYLHRRCIGHGTFLLIALRAEELVDDSPVHELAATTRITLAPLAEPDLAPLATGAAATRLLARSGGNPLWLAELVRAGADPDATEPPARLAELIVARCRRAGPRAHRLLAATSVLGRPFSPELAAALVGAEPLRVVEQLEELSTLGLTRPVGQGFDFRHDLIARALAAEVSPARRRLLHARALRELEATGAAPGELAGHAREAGLPDAALRWSLAAAAAARRTWSNVEAAEHYRRARQVADEHPDLIERAALEAFLVEYGRVLVTLRRVEEAEEVLREARASAERRRDERAAFAAVEGLAVARQRGASDPVGALELGRDALTRANRLGDPALIARAHTLVGSPSGSLGLLDDEVTHCSRAVAIAERSGGRPAAYPMGRVALGLHHQGREAVALEWADRAEAAAVDQHDEETLLLARWVRALAAAALGRPAAALAALDACGTVGRGEEVFWHARIPNTYGSVYADLCQFDAALERDLESLAVTAASAAGPVREAEFQTRLNLAADHLGLGDPAAAAEQLALVRAGADEVVYARFRWLPRLHALSAELAAGTGDANAAMEAAQACLELAAEPAQPKYEIRGRLAVAAAHLAAGEHEPAVLAAVGAAREAERLGFASLAWRGWWLADRAGGGPDARRSAQHWVRRVAGGLDGTLRARFLAAVPVDP